MDHRRGEKRAQDPGRRRLVTGAAMNYRRLFAGMCIAASITQSSTGQTVMDNDNSIQVLGSVQVGQAAVTLLIAYSADAAILEMSLPQGGTAKYVPLFASTYRGIPAVSLDVYVSAAKDQIWVQSSWPDAPVLAYHHLGSASAITSFGDLALMDSAFPESLGGGPLPFPAMAAQKVASFYHVEAP